MKMSNRKKSVALSALLVIACNVLVNSPAQAGSQQFPGMAAAKDSVKPYETVISAGAETMKGFITVHKVNNRFLLELPDSVIGRDLYTVNRITRSSQDWRNPLGGLCSFGGDWIGQCLFRFNKTMGDKLQLEVISTSERSDAGEDGVQNALMKNNLFPVYAVFPVKAYGKDKRSAVIDMTDYFNSDNPVFGYLPELKFLGMPGVYAPDRSFITSVKAFPMNIEVASTRTYSAGALPLTGEFNSSIILLSKEPMKGRSFDERVGYLAVLYTEYKQLTASSITPKVNIWRFRMEPKPEDLHRYYKGELVEPAKPIIFYIDPATPKKWVPYLIAGVNDWQKAFEKAGFKNAVMAKEVDPAGSTFDINDARHNVVVYKASAIGNAMGHTLQDPRSGEIIESHIQWYHSVMEVLYKWYFTQAAAVDTAAQKPQFSDELMGQLIRFVSSHEVGHALGLRHNWGSSSTSTVAQLRNKKWVEEHGHTPSIMDYARFNYVAQPEDSIGSAGIFPRIGDYDQWAIEWGYKLLPKDADAETEKKVLNQWIVDKLKQSDRYRFGIGDDPSAKYPDNQREDLGDDAMLAGKYGIKNLQRIQANLVKWVQIPGDNYDKLEDAYKALVGQFEWYIKHATANVGGEYFTPKTTEQPGAVFSYFSKEKQQRAIAFLNEELFTTPEWLNDQFINRHSKTGFTIVESIQRNAIKQLLDPKVFAKLRSQELADPSNSYTVTEMLNGLASGIFIEWHTGKNIRANRRAVQNMYVNELIALIALQTNLHLDAGAVIRQQARELKMLSKKVAAATNDELLKAHLEGISIRLEDALKTGK
ncbi:MAG: zinc-dependent metalloprotease [Pseudobacter sp.]|uniref:zinc-dependent metalloprotease n=1 Tax=Pseudobacter sp. TaxID=2045420 RepID=UPI003F80E5BA